MLWLALYLPNLPLDVCPAIATPPRPRLVVESAGRFERVVVVDALAQSLGIRAGIKLSAALALVNELDVHRRKPQAEAEALSALACWAQQFTPTVVIVEPAMLLLEVQGCLRYFGGLAALQSRIEAGLLDLDYTVQTGCAPTPLAASWRAGCGEADAITALAGVRAGIADLPLSVLPLNERQHAGLAQLGVTTLADLLTLPRAGVARRFGAEVGLWLDRALGLVADPRTAFVPPDRFKRCIDLDYPFEHVDVFVRLAERLLAELAGYLGGRGLGVQSVTFRFVYDDAPATLLEVGFGRPLRRYEEMLAVLRERAERIALAAPVFSVELRAEQLHALDGQALSLLDQRQQHGDLPLLLARLRARLGDEAVCAIATVADHRPERAWRLAGDGEASAPPPLGEQAIGERPGWLLPEPQALTVRDQRLWHDEPLRCIGRAERIEAGWWDGDSAVRDYWQALGPSGRRYWIYQDRHSLTWWLHGVF
ncbi:DNA polymerase Y family protein [Jeongeupia wiesaeckerbachi]|uniref:Y-family DNA polymerase n=1 Tax=Jeongeupia wiesaeckerbachi TaxID=3051218 RepID=UPI003D804A14